MTSVVNSTAMNIRVVVAVQSLNHVWLSSTPWNKACQSSLSFTISQIHIQEPDSCPLSRWCYLTISSSAALFFCFSSFPASVSFPRNWLFPSDGQSIGASASASVLPMNIQDWFPLNWLIWSLCSPRSIQGVPGVNSAAINIGVYVSSWIMVISSI